MKILTFTKVLLFIQQHLGMQLCSSDPLLVLWAQNSYKRIWTLKVTWHNWNINLLTVYKGRLIYSLYFRLCLCLFVLLDLSFCFFWNGFVVFGGVYFIINDLVYVVDWNIITLNGRSIIMTFLFDWMFLLFMGFVFIISSLVILYSDDYMFGDLNIIRFIMLVLM
jgi:NADH:ubiquinone oxidoreductase subunit 5 (subunit L)/multisubunit Na+/H+ antiporter MnhA subunit